MKGDAGEDKSYGVEIPREHREEHLMAPLRVQQHARELYRALKACREWAEFTGGWEAPCWDQADAAIRACDPEPEGGW